MTHETPRTRETCEALDRRDPLAGVRERFALPDGVIYLDGHSLGPATNGALDRVMRTAGKEWREGLIRSWNTAAWIDLPALAGAKIARLIGAKPGEVLVTDSVTLNLFKLAGAALKLAPQPVVMFEQDDFPTDQYVVQGLAGLAGAAPMQLAKRGALDTFANTRGVLVKSAVDYRTAEVADIAAWEATAKRNGSVIVWDLSHAAGVMDLDLNAAGVRLAAWCTYKYLNGGPGSPAFVYVSGMPEGFSSPIWGWFAAENQFGFGASFKQKAGAAGFAAGTPPVLSLATLDAALEAGDCVALSDVQAKARALGDLVIARVQEMGLEVISPVDASRRGGHVSVRHEQGYAVVQALIARGIVPDFRAPDAMRFGVAPLYVRFVDVWDAMDALADILATRAWDQPEFHARAKVT
jgi:kynureninase